MWLERFVIIPISLTRDFIPANWGYYSPTFWDWALFLGTMGLFCFLLFMFLKVLPLINIFEMRDLLLRINHHDHHAHGGTASEDHDTVGTASGAAGRIGTNEGAR